MATIKGGEKLFATLDKIARKARATLQVGWPAGATGADGQPLALRAAINEFGAPGAGIPPRPFFRNMIAAKSGEWPKAIGELLKDNGYDAANALGQVGEIIKVELQESIAETIEPALSPVTVMLRGMRAQKRYRDMPFGELIAEARARVAAGKTNYGASTKPLVDSGQMQNGVVSIVK